MLTRMVQGAWVLVFFIMLQTGAALAQEERGQIIIHENSDYFGFDLLTKKDVSLDQCKASCLNNLGCVAFTYNVSAQFCFLKSDFGELKPFSGAIAGRLEKAGTEPDIGAPQKLTFLPEYLYDNARNLSALIAGRDMPAANIGFEALWQAALKQFGNSDATAVTRSLFSALKINPKHQPSWVLLSKANLQRKSDKSSQRRLFKKTALSAALNGYSLSRSKVSRASSLAVLARALEAQTLYRAALTAFELSLEMDDNSQVRQAFVRLREAQGFRVLNHTVDSDNLSPRLCVQFSEDLLGKKAPASFSGYEDFINVDQSPPQAIDVSQRQICIEGVEHGRTYKVKFRQGLPSKDTEALSRDINLEIYVRDRGPSVRFTGSNFVLPATTRRGIPMVTVNTKEVDLELYRVGERALAPLLRDSKFLQQLGSYQVENLVDEMGQAVWNGSIEIAPQLNKEVITSIPVDEALPQRKPGIYFLTASPTNAGPDQYDIRATQWFLISDIGLTTFSGGEHLRVFARSLSSANPIEGVEMTLIARNNQVLGTSLTGSDGQATFDAGLLRGKAGLVPAVVTAKDGNEDFVFIDMLEPGFDFSDRGVAGRAVPQGIDVYAWSERGIYRAGETVTPQPSPVIMLRVRSKTCR